MGSVSWFSFLLRRDIPSSAKCFELTGAVCYAIALVFSCLLCLSEFCSVLKYVFAYCATTRETIY